MFHAFEEGDNCKLQALLDHYGVDRVSAAKDCLSKLIYRISKGKAHQYHIISHQGSNDLVAA